MGKFKLSSMVFVLGLGLLGMSGMAILSFHQGFAQKLITLTFWTFVLGTLVYACEK